jgi:tripartite-type tricarboxylate transporter receptor subunit TctC
LDAELVKAVNAPELRERFAALGVEPATKNSQQMSAYLKMEVDKYGKIVRAIGLKID